MTRLEAIAKALEQTVEGDPWTRGDLGELTWCLTQLREAQQMVLDGQDIDTPAWQDWLAALR